GLSVEEEVHSSDYAYYCRHYRRNDANPEPPRRGTGANLDFLWYGLFCAEGGYFSIAMACPTEERELLDLLKRPECFDAACEQIPVLAQWVRGAEPSSKVLGAAQLANRWRNYRPKAGAELLGFFPVGDALMHTNPMFGRGCSSAFVEAHA